MKKLGKMKLNEFHQMSESEMRNIAGGSGTDDSGNFPSGYSPCPSKYNDNWCMVDFRSGYCTKDNICRTDWYL